MRPQQAAQLAEPRAIIARLQSAIHTLTMASPVPLNPANETEPVRRRLVKFTNKFRGNTCWNQYRQVFDAIIKSNGWDGTGLGTTDVEMPVIVGTSTDAGVPTSVCNSMSMNTASGTTGNADLGIGLR